MSVKIYESEDEGRCFEITRMFNEGKANGNLGNDTHLSVVNLYLFSLPCLVNLSDPNGDTISGLFPGTFRCYPLAASSGE